MARILIVDDEKSIRTTLSEFVKDAGHEALTAKDADEALRLLRDSVLDVLITDIILPGGTGVDLLRRIQAVRPDLPVIMITGEPTVDTAAGAVREGAFDYLAKPITGERIRSAVEDAVRAKRLADARAERERQDLLQRLHLENQVEAAARALEESETKYRTVVENANEAVFVIQEDRIRFANPKTIEITGYNPTQLAQLSAPELIHPEDRPAMLDRQRRRLDGEEVASREEIRMVASSGAVRWLEIRSVVIDWDGRPAVLHFAGDITERVAAERALEESEVRYRTLFENSPISLWQEDYSETKRLLDGLRAEGIDDLREYLQEHPEVVDECIRRILIVDVNQATVAMHAAADKEELRGNLSQIIPVSSRPQFIEQLVGIAEGKTYFESTGTDRRFDGSLMHVAVRWAVPPGFEDTYARVLVSKLDITATVEAEGALQAALQGTIEAIGRTTETRDPYTAGHQRRVTALAVAMAEELALDEEQIEGIRAAGLMHDIGKMAIPAEILSKPSALSPTEMALMESHPSAAYDILKTVTFPWPLAKIVLQHHERVDGTGYPQGLSGEEILIEARVLAVADTVEAMASHRPYRAALGIDLALDEIERHRGTRYDVEVTDACLRLFREGRFTFESAAVSEGRR